MERSHVYVEDASANQVARRMADCLRMESVAVQYEDVSSCSWARTKDRRIEFVFILIEKLCSNQLFLLQSLARCDTCEHVKFNIRLFTSGKKIVVEIQRVSGCCFLFHQATKNILRAALGQEAQPSVILTVPPCVMSELEEEDATEEALFFALNMLQSPRFDCNVLAMESLASVTKANSVAAKSVVNGPLMTLILGWVEGQNAEDQDFHDQEHSVKMHRYALVILANCLTALSPTDTPKVSDDCLKILIGELKAACERPHDACEAAKSLKALVRSSDVRLRALAMGAPSALMGAYQLGKSQHHQLERESLSLQMEMGN